MNTLRIIKRYKVNFIKKISFILICLVSSSVPTYSQCSPDTEPPNFSLAIGSTTQPTSPNECFSVFSSSFTNTLFAPVPNTLRDNCVASEQIEVTYSYTINGINTTGATSMQGVQFPLGTTVVSITADDDNSSVVGNVRTQSINVTIVDQENPTFSACPTVTLVDNDPNTCGAVVNYTAPIGIDNCPVAQTFIAAPNANLDLCCSGVSEGYFFTAPADFTITGLRVAPVFGGNQNVQVVRLATPPPGGFGNGVSHEALLFHTNNVAGDNFIPVNIPIQQGQIIGILGTRGTDDRLPSANGFGGSTPILAGEPTTIRHLYHPGLISQGPIGGQNYQTFTSYIIPVDFTYTSNSFATERIAGLPSGSVFPVGTTTVTYRATDAANNTKDCSFNVVVNDGENPTFTALADRNQNLNTNCQIIIPDLVSEVTDAADNCVASPTIMQNPAANTAVSLNHNQTTTVQITVADGNGNSVMKNVTLTAKDVIDPTFTAPTNRNRNLNTNCQIIIPDLVSEVTDAADNCAMNPTVTQSPTANTPISLSHNQTTMVQITVADGNDNSTVKNVTLTAKDVIDPTFTAPANRSLNLNANCEIIIPNLVSEVTDAADNCAMNPTVTQNPTANTPVSLSHNQTTMVQITVADGNGNSVMKNVTLTAKDVIDPTFTAPTNRNRNLNANCQIIIPNLVSEVTDAADNCAASPTVTQNPTANMPVSLNHNQTATVQITVADGNGNSVMKNVTLTAKDAINPTFTAPADRNQNLNTNCQITIPDLVSEVTDAADNCAMNPTVTQNPTANTAVNLSHNQITTVQITVADGNGNSVMKNVTLTAKDVIDPTFTAPQNRDLNLNANCEIVIPDLVSEVTDAADNCAQNPTVTQNPTANMPVSLNHNQTTTVQITVADGNGNSTVKDVTLTAKDVIDPTFTAPADRNQNLNTNCQIIIPDLVSEVTDAADNCAMNPTITQNPTANTTVNLNPNQITQVQITVADGNGNSTVKNVTLKLTANGLPMAELSSSDADNTICVGDNVTFTASGGTSYRFFKNNVSVQSGSTATYSSNTWANNDQIKVEVTNANGCKATSSEITLTVNALPTAGLTSSDADNSINLGESVTFTATGGTNYNFLVNDISVQEGVQNTYTTTDLRDNDEIKVVVTNTNNCKATSNTIMMTVKETNDFAEAGPSQTNVCGTMVQLAAVEPIIGTGEWTVTPSSGSFVDPTKANTQFSGNIGVTYVLTWTVIGASDQVQISFSGDADNDTVQDCLDLCPDGDDRINTDGVGMPDACDCDPNDPNDEFVSLPGVIITKIDLDEGIYQSSHSLTSTARSNPNKAIVFKASQSITLQAGFHAQLGTDFSAKIEYCNLPGNPLVTTETASFRQVLQEVLMVQQEKAKGVEVSAVSSSARNEVKGMVFTVGPNPFREKTTAFIELPISTKASLSIFDAQGRLVKMVLHEAQMPAGQYQLPIMDLPSSTGIFYVYLRTEGERKVQKVMAVR